MARVSPESGFHAAHQPTLASGKRDMASTQPRPSLYAMLSQRMLPTLEEELSRTMFQSNLNPDPTDISPSRDATQFREPEIPRVSFCRLQFVSLEAERLFMRYVDLTSTFSDLQVMGAVIIYLCCYSIIDATTNRVREGDLDDAESQWGARLAMRSLAIVFMVCVGGVHYCKHTSRSLKRRRSTGARENRCSTCLIRKRSSVMLIEIFVLLFALHGSDALTGRRWSITSQLHIWTLFIALVSLRPVGVLASLLACIGCTMVLPGIWILAHSPFLTDHDLEQPFLPFIVLYAFGVLVGSVWIVRTQRMRMALTFVQWM